MTTFSSFNEELDAVLGAEGTPEREANRQLAMQEYVSDTLLQARRQSGMSQQQLADKVGTTKAYISKIENGRVNPSAAVYLSLMAAVGYTMQLTV
ncbi:MAG: helix-turn-helix transcriptional regulator [Bacteroidales bacterium]|nr:helix-turn-helix transcriptional regulator [Candidatus Physcousia equi]